MSRESSTNTSKNIKKSEILHLEIIRTHTVLCIRQFYNK